MRSQDMAIATALKLSLRRRRRCRSIGMPAHRRDLRRESGRLCKGLGSALIQMSYSALESRQQLEMMPGHSGFRDVEE